MGGFCWEDIVKTLEVVLCVTCNFTEFLLNLDNALGLGNVAHIELHFSDVDMNIQELPSFHYEAVILDKRNKPLTSEGKNCFKCYLHNCL